MDKYKKVLDVLDKLNIKYDIIYHKPVYIIEEIDELGYDYCGVVAKNLFLINDNGNQHYLVVLQKDKTVDLKEILNKGMIGVHTNDNTATIFLDFGYLIKVIELNGNKTTYVKI